MISRRKVLEIVRAERDAMDGYSDPAWSALDRILDAVMDMDEIEVKAGDVVMAIRRVEKQTGRRLLLSGD